MCMEGRTQMQPTDEAAWSGEQSGLHSDPVLGLETYRLWPGRAEDASGDGPAETPTITVFYPQPGLANGTAVIVAPGGGYVGLAANLEGRQVADWFASRGITAFVLHYRVGPTAHLPIPLSDGRPAVQRAPAHCTARRPSRNRMGRFAVRLKQMSIPQDFTSVSSS